MLSKWKGKEVQRKPDGEGTEETWGMREKEGGKLKNNEHTKEEVSATNTSHKF